MSDEREWRDRALAELEKATKAMGYAEGVFVNFQRRRLQIGSVAQQEAINAVTKLRDARLSAARNALAEDQDGPS